MLGLFRGNNLLVLAATSSVQKALDAVMPAADSFYLFAAQPTYTGYGNNDNIALPFPDLVFGMNFDIFLFPHLNSFL